MFSACRRMTNQKGLAVLMVSKTSRGFAAKSKIVRSVEEALDGVQHGQTLLCGGFGVAGIPENLIHGVIAKGLKNLTIVSNNCGIDDWGLGLMLRAGCIKRMIASYVGGNEEFEKAILSGRLEAELTPQGTLAERIRAGGAGIPAFYTPTGVGTVVETGGFPIKMAPDGVTVEIQSEPRPKATFDGKEYLQERAIRGNFSLIKAWKADEAGNLVYRRTARNFNEDMAPASDITIAEVEEIVPNGTLDPDQIHTPGVFVHRIFKPKKFEKRFEKLIYADGTEIDPHNGQPIIKKEGGNGIREKIGRRAAREMKDGMYVNLGIGMPTLIPKFLPKDMEIWYHCENGLFGVGNYPNRGQEDPDLINAGKEPITFLPGASAFSSSLSFAMIRGHHMDLTVLGGMQVSQNGDLANWVIPGKKVKGMGGAMDLVSSGSRVIVVMEHTAKGKPKILPHCTLPLTGKGIVKELITEKAYFKWKDGIMVLTEIAEGLKVDDIYKTTTAKFEVVPNLQTF